MYAKIFTQIYDSSIRENPEARFTFMDLLILADLDGVVDMTHEAIAARTNRPLEIIRKTIEELEGPDLRSRTPANEGRRIIRLDDHRDWGWLIVNYERFRKTASEEQRREKTRIRVAKFKQKHQQNAVGNAPLTHGNAPLTHGNATNAMQMQKQKQKQKQNEEAEVPAVAGEHGAFIEGWCQNYKAVWNVDYKMDGGRDGKAVKELLTMGILRIDLLEIAKKAWQEKPQTFETKQACTIHGFRAYFNQLNIRAQPGSTSDKSTYPSGRTATQIIMGMAGKSHSEMNPEELAAFSECLR